MKRLFSIFVIVFMSLSFTYADTDGIWHYAKDIRPGVFGSDEMSGDYEFRDNVSIINSSLYLYSDTTSGIFSESTIGNGVAGKAWGSLNSAIYGWGKNGAYSGYFEGGNFVVGSHNVGIGVLNPAYKLDVAGNVNAFDYTGNSLTVSGNAQANNVYALGRIGVGTTTPSQKLDVAGIVRADDVIIDNQKGCSKLYADSSGKVLCGTDNVNDGDTSSTNELQNLNSVLSRGNNGGGQRIVNIANPASNQDAATKKYVDDKVASASGGNIEFYDCNTRTSNTINGGNLCDGGKVMTNGYIHNVQISDGAVSYFDLYATCCKIRVN